MGDETTTTTTTLDVVASPPATPPAQTGDTGKTFTQKDVDRIAGEARDKGRQTALTDLLSQLGVSDVSTLKDALSKLTQYENERKTETERQAEALAQERQKREAAEKTLAELQERQRQTALDSAIRTHAATLRAEHPEDVVTWARSGDHDLNALLTKDGTPIEEKVKELVEAARRDRPKWFIGTGPGSPSNAEGRAPDHTTAGKEVARVEAERRIRNMF